MSIAYTAVVCVATIVALELLFGAAGIGEQEYLQPDPKLGFSGIPNKRVTWRTEGFSRVQLNELGLPDVHRSLDKDPSKTRVAVIGDSYIEALQVDPDKNMCTVLERENKNLEVLNFGTSAYNLGQMYLRLREQVLRYHPDIVIIAMRPNGVFGLVPEPKGGFLAARPTFYLTPEGKLAESNAIQEEWQKSREGKRIRTTSWLRAHSRIWGVVSLVMQDLQSSMANLPKPAAVPVATTGADKPPTELAVGRKDPNDPNTAKATKYYWPIADALIGKAKSACDAAGAKLVLVRIPKTGDYQNDFETAMLRDTAERLSIPLVETDAAFAASALKGKRLFYDVHLTAAGHQLLAELLRDKLASTGNISLAGSPNNILH